MSLPTLITVEGTYLKPDGDPETGVVTFRSNVFALSSEDSTVMAPGPVRVELDETGSISVQLPATNDPDWSPEGWTYSVHARLSESTSAFDVLIPYDAAGATISLSHLVPVGPADGNLYAPYNHTHEANSVSWEAILNKPTTFAPTAHQHAASDVNSGTLNFSRIPTGTTGTTVAIGNHTHSQYANAISSVVTLLPSGDTSGNTDTAAITASLIANAKTNLAPGQWYVKNIGLVTNSRWLTGYGPATVLNVVSGNPGLTITGPGDIHVSDLVFSGGTYGIVVNGCYDGKFENLKFTGQTSGGVKVNGDLATEQHWTDVTMRGVGGVGFAIDRTTSIYTGSLYMDRVRIVEPAVGATYGFKFDSSAGSPSLNIAFMNMCVADNYAGTAFYANNVGQVFVSNSWFAINGSGPSGSAAMKIVDGFQHSYSGCYTYSGKTDPSVVISGTSRGIDIGAGHVFDGTPSTVAIGLNTATPGGFTLGSYQNFCGGGITDTPSKLTLPQPTLPGTTASHGEETFSRMLCNSVTQVNSGTLLLTFFTATKSELISTVEAMVNEAKSGATYCGYGLYTVASDGTLTLVAKAEQTSSPSLWNSAFQPIGGFDTKLGLSQVYQKIEGQQYAIGALFVGTTGPKLISNLASNGTPQSNIAISGTTLGNIAAMKTGQTTLGTVGSTTHTAASLSGSSAAAYFVLN